jgi:DNA polymerase-3 subunit gamma/tau
MTHTALARKYRPKLFSDLVAQDHVGLGLAGAVARDRVAHGYLFAGPRGVGKTTAARVLAMALNCAERGVDGEPCGTCVSCARIWTGAASLDVVEIDAASNRGVDDARDLRERAMYAASAPGRSKVYIVDEAHMLTREAWNALLKILEEPPSGVVFVFATTEPQKIAQAAAPVLSRLQRFDFRRIGPLAVEQRLTEVARAEEIAVAADALALIAVTADGGMRDALSVLDQVVTLGEGRVTAQAVREALGLVPEELFGELLGLVADRQPAGVFPLVDKVVEAGADLVTFAQGAGDALRALLMLQVGDQPRGVSQALGEVVARYRDRIAPEDALRMLDLLVQAEADIRRGLTRLALETLLLKWTMLDRVADLAAVLTALGGASPPAPAVRPAPRGGAASARATPMATRPAAQRQPAATAEATAPVAPSPAPAPAPTLGPFTVAHFVGVWSDILAHIGAKHRFLAQALAGAEPVEASPPVLVVAIRDADEMRREAIERRRVEIEQVLGRYVDEPVRLRVETRPRDGGQRPARLTEEEARAERLRALRARDPALDRATDALDLDLLE